MSANKSEFQIENAKKDLEAYLQIISDVSATEQLDIARINIPDQKITQEYLYGYISC